MPQNWSLSNISHSPGDILSLNKCTSNYLLKCLPSYLTFDKFFNFPNLTSLICWIALTTVSHRVVRNLKAVCVRCQPHDQHRESIESTGVYVVRQSAGLATWSLKASPLFHEGLVSASLYLLKRAGLGRGSLFTATPMF